MTRKTLPIKQIQFLQANPYAVLEDFFTFSRKESPQSTILHIINAYIDIKLNFAAKTHKNIKWSGNKTGCLRQMLNDNPYLNFFEAVEACPFYLFRPMFKLVLTEQELTICGVWYDTDCRTPIREQTYINSPTFLGKERTCALDKAIYNLTKHGDITLAQYNKFMELENHLQETV